MSGAPVATAPLRPDAAPGARRPSRGGWATLAVLGVILVVVLGGYVAAAALSEPAGPPVAIPGIVSIRPLSGWVFARRGAIGDVPFVQLTRGSGNIAALAYAAPPDDSSRLAGVYVETVLSKQLSQLSVSSRPESVRLLSGVPGVRFAYIGVVAATGTSIEGEVTVVVAPSGHGVVFDGWAPAGLLSFVRSDIRTMVLRAEVS